MMWGYYPSWGGMFLMMVFGNILWIALLGVLVWVVIRWFNRRPNSFGSSRTFAGPPAMEILSQRYARGEIDTATFEQMRERMFATSEGSRSAEFNERSVGGTPR
ncbi:MAG TPA: SHOCT domain-containing protein [Ktedonobacteraceae bacterium]|nr:SHOCT domain-containing protein [Ktedonobacteraceae bacterium]